MSIKHLWKVHTKFEPENLTAARKTETLPIPGQEYINAVSNFAQTRKYVLCALEQFLKNTIFPIFYQVER